MAEGVLAVIQTGDVLNVKVTPTHYATVTVVMGESSQTMNITNPVMMDDYINVLPGDAEFTFTVGVPPGCRTFNVLLSTHSI